MTTFLVVWFDKLLPVAAVVVASWLSWRLGRASARVEELLAEVRGGVRVACPHCDGPVDRIPERPRVVGQNTAGVRP